MAVYKIFPEKDATLYSEYPVMNTGRDEILEISSYYKGTQSYVARTVIAFDQTEVNSVLNTYVSSSTREATDFSASLKLYLATANELPTSYTILANPVYVPSNLVTWNAGSGKYGDSPTNSSGVSWAYTQSTGSGGWTADQVSGETEFSYSGSVGGGQWYYESDNYTYDSTQTHTVISTHDIDIDVTNGVKAHYEEDILNAGFLLRLTGSLEFNAYANSRQLLLKYFSVDTHTIYPPCLEIKWNDFTDDTNLSDITDSNAVIKIKNNRGRYTDEGFQKFRLHVRPKYPVRTFSTSSNYLDNYVLPIDSYWGIRDENTEEMVVEFDTTYTKLSRDNDGNYFTIHMGGLEPERYYRILLKSTIDGSTNIYDEDLVFKVVRNG